MTYTYVFVAGCDIDLLRLTDPKDALLNILHELRTDFALLCEKNAVCKLDDLITSLSRTTFDDFFNQYNIGNIWSLQLYDDAITRYELVITRHDNYFSIHAWSNLDDDRRWDAVLKYDPIIPTHIEY